MLPVIDDADLAAEYLDRLDGIIISGGCDVSPVVTGQDAIAAVGEICQERDAQEIALTKGALSREGFPVLGICRGCQVMNVALCGTIVQDMDTSKTGAHFLVNQRMDTPTHFVEVKEGSLIEKILGCDRRVNSYHHQCVEKPGEGLEVTAFDARGVPECIELPGRKGFTLGVQWHPEGLAGRYSAHAEIFRALTKAAAEYADGKRG